MRARTWVRALIFCAGDQLRQRPAPALDRGRPPGRGDARGMGPGGRRAAIRLAVRSQQRLPSRVRRGSRWAARRIRTPLRPFGPTVGDPRARTGLQPAALHLAATPRVAGDAAYSPAIHSSPGHLLGTLDRCIAVYLVPAGAGGWVGQSRPSDALG